LICHAFEVTQLLRQGARPFQRRLTFEVFEELGVVVQAIPMSLYPMKKVCDSTGEVTYVGNET
jgi:hypothetical protein